MERTLALFADAVRRELRRRGWTSPELARRAGISAKSLNNILNCRHAPQLDQLVSIARVLELDFWQMWLPAAPDGFVADDTIPKLVFDYGRLSPEARAAVARIVELESKNRE
jgi:transcriptional regulator with XRE-family HTH domain